MGSTFDQAILILATNALRQFAPGTIDKHDEDLTESGVDILRMEGILEVGSGQDLRFAHDQLLQTANSMIPDPQQWKVTIEEALLWDHGLEGE